MRSWMYCPGNSPKKMIHAGVYGADGLVLDLEDSVATGEKDEARILVAQALKEYDFGSAAVAVRINAVGTEWWEDDLRTVVPAGARILRIPKVESVESVDAVETAVDSLEKENLLSSGSVRLQCILETPLGVEDAFRIAEASDRLESLSFGAEDYCAATGLRRYGPDYALDYPRSRIVSAAASRGLVSYDTVWGAFRDADGLRRDAERARSLGFDGKSVIHPGQIETVNAVFSYSDEEKAWAARVLERVGIAEAGGNGDGIATEGVFTVDGAMVDAPVIRRARRILEGGVPPGE